MPKPSWIFTLPVFLAVAACSGSTTANPAGGPCPAIAVAAVLNYPANGATQVVDSLAIVVVSGAPGNTLYLKPATGPTLVTTTFEPVPEPLPTPNIALGSARAKAFAVTTLAPATTYVVTDVVPSACPDGFSGTFTTK